MADMPAAAGDHMRYMQRLGLVTVSAGRRAWRRVRPDYISESWAEQLEDLGPVVAGAQLYAATDGATYSAMALAQQGTYVQPRQFVDPRAFPGVASDGRGLAGLLYSPATTTKAAIANGVAPAVALRSGMKALDRILTTVVADAGRQGAGADIAARPGVGYTRMVNPGACDRCAILAGRFYRWNDGFLRHPDCMCEHVATTASSEQEAFDRGLIEDPYEYFESLSEEEQDRRFGKAGAQAIRDGADMSQVVNARRGMTANGHFTVEGTSRYGHAAQGLRRGQRRLTPEGIYENAERFGGRTDAERREYALQELRTHGYILPQGQVAKGAIRGQREGFGAMGRGGTRKAASEAVQRYRETGIRDPRSRYTMTDQERRLFDAERRYERAMSGVSPYTPPGFGQTPDPYGLGLNRTGGPRPRAATPTEMALAESEYRWALSAWGDRPIPWRS